MLLLVHVVLPILTFALGAWVALVVRALIAESSQRRIQAAAQSLDPEHLERLRGYLDDVDKAVRGYGEQPSNMVLVRDRGSTTVRLP